MLSLTESNPSTECQQDIVLETALPSGDVHWELCGSYAKLWEEVNPL